MTDSGPKAGKPQESAQPAAGAPAPKDSRPLQDIPESELLISGVNTGPALEERQERTPTEERARIKALAEREAPDLTATEPDNEDG